MIQPAVNPLEVSYAVAVSIHIGANGKAIDDGILIPEVVNHRSRLPPQPAELTSELVQSDPGLAETETVELHQLRIVGRCRKIRANARRCFSPPDKD